MRLTLRNMLASMDEILEPAQQEEIKRKINESEFATGVMHRIRDVTRRIRLGAPKLTGKGMGLDPNTVSMYLDNTLSADRVPDFEKVCLESDIHLAEVAACHQVLALVLGEPAEVDANLRRRLYELGKSEAAQGAEAPKLPPPLPPVTPRIARRERPRVPDYLREDRRSRVWAIAGTILLALLLIAGVIRAIGPYDRTNRALAWLPIWGEDEGGATNQKQSAKADDSAVNGDRQENTAQANNAADANDVTANSAKTNPSVESDAATATKSATLTNPLNQVGKTLAVDGSKATTTDTEKAPFPPEPDDVKTSTNAATAASALPASVPDALPVNTKTATSTTSQPADGSETPRAAQAVGRFLADPNVLLRLNGAGEWERVPQGATLTAGDRLLVLPTYRPSITLSGGLTLQLLGETLVELLPSDAAGIARIRMPYGRLVLMTAGKPDVAVHLLVGQQEDTAKFVDANSTLAVDVRPFLPAGADPEKEKAYVAVDLYVPSGQIDWQTSATAQPTQIAGPGHITLGTPYPFSAPDAPELPAWIIAEKLAGLDDLASGPANKALSEDNKRPVALAIRELAEDRRVELKYFGARSLALMDEFDFFIPAFNDNDQRAAWSKQIESLQAALARGPETAAKVREAFERQRGEDGRKLYRILWGYSKADLQSGAAAQLVEYLDNNSLDFRVLAIYALRSVPGVPSNYSSYQPGAHAAELQQQVRRWREYIKDGPLSPKGALDRPGPLPKNQPPAPEPPAGDDESARLPQSVPFLR